MSDPENLTLDKMWEAVEALKAKMPPRTEIWVTQHLPYNPNEDTILEIDTDKVNIRDMTVTNADRVLMMVLWNTGKQNGRLRSMLDWRMVARQMHPISRTIISGESCRND